LQATCADVVKAVYFSMEFAGASQPGVVSFLQGEGRVYHPCPGGDLKVGGVDDDIHEGTLNKDVGTDRFVVSYRGF
jgi:hypothetical protein